MPIKLGQYSVLPQSGSTPVRFWPLVPGTTVVAATPPVLVAPNNPATNNTVTPPPHFGIFDIVIEMSEPAVEEVVTEQQSTDLLLTQLAGAPTITTMPLIREGDDEEQRVINISFAVPIAVADTFFEGKLQLKARNATTTSVTNIKELRLPLKVDKWQRAGDMFVFYIVRPQNKKPARDYCWLEIPTMQWAAMAPLVPVPGAEVKARVLRDNFQNGYNEINRRVLLTSEASGSVAYAHTNGHRTVLGMPIDWPLIFNATKASFVPRGHMIRLRTADIRHNLEPFRASDIRMMRVSDARMTNKTVLLDPGHGVVYALTAHRRSQEWFVAHQIADRVAAILLNRFQLPQQNLLWTRTAGLGLIDPGSIGANNAPEQGATRYTFDLTNRRVRIKLNALGLKHISDLLLTRHDNNNNARPVNEDDRNRLITVNAQTVNAIITRINGNLPAGQRVRPDSVRWDTADNRYVYTVERTNPSQAQASVVHDAVAFSIQTGDWFTLDDDMVEVLAERTARWSITNEVAGQSPADATAGRPAFRDAARDALRATGALEYMREQIIRELGILPAPAVYNGTMGWGPTTRRTHINGKNCDVSLTIHENANPANQIRALGTAMLVTETAPPDNQVHLAKIFVKYVDPFDKGTHGGGIAGNGAGQLAATNTVRGKHAYFELEFMDTVNPDDASQYRYQQMIRGDFLDNVAEQIVAGVVEFLLDQQSDLDTVTYDNASLSSKW